MAVKYYSDDWPTNAARLAFEKSVFTKTQKTNARTEGIIMNLISEPIVSLVVFVQDLRIIVNSFPPKRLFQPCWISCYNIHD